MWVDQEFYRVNENPTQVGPKKEKRCLLASLAIMHQCRSSCRLGFIQQFECLHSGCPEPHDLTLWQQHGYQYFTTHIFLPHIQEKKRKILFHGHPSKIASHHLAMIVLRAQSQTNHFDQKCGYSNWLKPIRASLGLRKGSRPPKPHGRKQKGGFTKKIRVVQVKGKDMNARPAIIPNSGKQL